MPRMPIQSVSRRTCTPRCRRVDERVGEALADLVGAEDVALEHDGLARRVDRARASRRRCAGPSCSSVDAVAARDVGRGDAPEAARERRTARTAIAARCSASERRHCREATRLSRARRVALGGTSIGSRGAARRTALRAAALRSRIHRARARARSSSRELERLLRARGGRASARRAVARRRRPPARR